MPQQQIQRSLFDAGPARPHFGGATYEPAQDERRLVGHLAAVKAAMADGQWRTLDAIQDLVVHLSGKEPSQAGVSARLRDLRKEEFGGHTVERRRVSGGLYEYRLILRSTRSPYDPGPG